MDTYSRLIVDAVRDALVLLDLDLRVRTANRSFCRMSGVSIGEAQGRLIYDIRDGRWNSTELRELLQSVLSEKKRLEDFVVEDEFEGRRRVLLLTARRVEDARYIMLTFEDVTERVRTGRKVRQQDERFRKLVEASARMLWTTDEVGLVVEDSPSWRAFTGQSRDEIIGEGWADAVHPEDRASFVDRWRRYVESQSPVNVELRLWHAPSGTWRWTNVRAVPLRNDGGVVWGWIGMTFDINERKRAEERLREMAAQLTISEHEERCRISEILHEEIQQQLYAMTMLVGMVRKDVREGETKLLQKHLAELEEWLQGSRNILKNLTADLSPPITTREGLADALTSLVNRMEKLYGLDVELKAEGRFRNVEEHMRVLLYRDVRELLFNVVKHAGTNEAKVELRQLDDEIEIVVADSGAGFDPEAVALQMDEVDTFGLFNLGDRLGLFGGTLAIESAPGEGTRITIRVPLLEESADCPGDPPPKSIENQFPAEDVT